MEDSNTTECIVIIMNKTRAWIRKNSKNTDGAAVCDAELARRIDRLRGSIQRINQLILELKDVGGGNRTYHDDTPEN